MIVCGSRGSALARWQAEWVAARLAERTGEEVRLEVFVTKGDKVLDRPLPSIGGKGLFTAELEAALRDGRIDIAVHSMKDLPVEDPDGLMIGATPERAAVADVLVYDPAHEDPTRAPIPLKAGCRIGTSSHRRRSALCIARPDLEFADVRGNVPTRIEKVRRGDYAGIVLAAAGLDRLGVELGSLRRVDLPVDLSTPAPAQGALAVQCRREDERVRALLVRLDHEPTSRAARAERDLLFRLGGGCSMPLGALVTTCEQGYRLRAALFANPSVVERPERAIRFDETGDDLDAMVARAAERMLPLVGDPLSGTTLVLLRPDGKGGELAAALEVAGARVSVAALTRTEPIELAIDVPARLAGRAVCFTSARGVERFAAMVEGSDLTGVPMFAAGPATAAAALARGWRCEAPSDGCGGAALGSLLASRDLPARGVLFPCAEERHPDLERALAGAGIAVEPLPIYRTIPEPDAELREEAGSWLLFTSPSAVAAFAARERAGVCRHLAIGRATAAAMREHGVRCDVVASSPTVSSLIHSLSEFRHA